MVPEGITKETWLFEVSISSGTLLRLMIEASSGRIMVVLIEVSVVKVQYLPVFEVKSGVKYEILIRLAPKLSMSALLSVSVWSKGRFCSSTMSSSSWISPSNVVLIEGNVSFTASSWFMRTNPSRKTFSVKVSEVTGLLAKARVVSCEAASKSNAPRIALLPLPSHIILSANVQVCMFKL